VLVFEFSFLFPSSFPCSGKREADARLGDNLDQPCAVSSAVTFQARVQIVGAAQVMTGVFIGLIEM
jgi:hypothetical protein